MEFQLWYLALLRLFSVTNGFDWFWMESLHKSIQEIPKGSIFGPILFLLYNDGLPDVICNIAI